MYDVLSGHALEGRQHACIQIGVIDQRRRSLVDFELDLRPRALRNQSCRTLHAPVNLLAHVLIESANRSLHFDPVRYHIIADAPGDPSDTDDRRCFCHVHLAAFDGLPCHDDLGRHDDRIDPAGELPDIAILLGDYDRLGETIQASATGDYAPLAEQLAASEPERALHDQMVEATRTLEVDVMALASTNTATGESDLTVFRDGVADVLADHADELNSAATARAWR